MPWCDVIMWQLAVIMAIQINKFNLMTGQDEIIQDLAG